MQNELFMILIAAHVAFICIAPMVALFFVNQSENLDQKSNVNETRSAVDVSLIGRPLVA